MAGRSGTRRSFTTGHFGWIWKKASSGWPGWLAAHSMKARVRSGCWASQEKTRAAAVGWLWTHSPRAVAPSGWS